MLGAIIGDIIGSRWEFNPTNDYHFELFSDKNSFTDDTICTVAVADALLHESDDYGKFIHKWCRRYPNPMGGYGNSFAKWVKSDNPKPYGSFGNGSAMRVSPIGWWFGQAHELSEEAEKSASCTHNHPEGILEAQAVAFAIFDARWLKSLSGPKLTSEMILLDGLSHGTTPYTGYGKPLELNIEDYRNKFDETCQGTVPVALWIALHSTSFEDAIRQAVSLGADADTLAAIVGSIAEPLWGIPEWMKQKALSYLPDDMKAVISEFHIRIKRLRKLTARCQYYAFGEYNPIEKETQWAYDIEHKWAHELARSFTHADQVKEEMALRFPMNEWQSLADDYDLPVTLVGYIARQLLTKKHKTLKVVVKCLEKYYHMRKAAALKKKQEKEQKLHFMAIMHWKLGLGNFNKQISGESPLPNKSKTATLNDWKTESMPNNSEDVSEVTINFMIPSEPMKIIQKGHIPESQEDHWFMYCDEEYIRYFRSWTGMCSFEAHYIKEGEDYLIDKLRINRNLAEFGVNGDEAGTALFRYLIIAESGGNSEKAWNDYISAWDILEQKYSKK